MRRHWSFIVLEVRENGSTPTLGMHRLYLVRRSHVILSKPPLLIVHFEISISLPPTKILSSYYQTIMRHLALAHSHNHIFDDFIIVTTRLIDVA